MEGLNISTDIVLYLLGQEGDPTAAIAAENALKIKRKGMYPSEAGA